MQSSYQDWVKPGNRKHITVFSNYSHYLLDCWLLFPCSVSGNKLNSHWTSREEQCGVNLFQRVCNWVLQLEVQKNTAQGNMKVLFSKTHPFKKKCKNLLHDYLILLKYETCFAYQFFNNSFSNLHPDKIWIKQTPLKKVTQ